MFKATFRIKIDLPKKKFFLSFLDFEQNLFGPLTRNFCALFSQLQLRVHSNVFIKNIFFKKSIFSKSSSVFTRSFFLFWSEKLRQSWQKCTFYVRRTFHEKNILKKIKHTQHLRILSELLLRIVMKLQQSYQNFKFCDRRFFWAKTFVLKKSLITELFSNCERKFSGRIF